MSARLYRLVEVAGGEPVPAAVAEMQPQAAGLLQKDKKACSRCGEIHDLQSFFDPTLKNGAGG